MEKSKFEVTKEIRNQKLLSVWGTVVILWSLYRANTTYSVWFNELLAKPIIFILPVYLYCRFVLHQSFFKGISLTKKNIFKEIYFGVAFFLLVIGFGFFLILNNKGAPLFSSPSFSNLWFYYLLISLATAFSEEIVGRGFLFNELHKLSNNFLSSLFVSSTLFFVLYLPGILASGITGTSLLVNLLFNFLLSFIAAIIFYLRKNLFSAIFFHAGILFLFDLFLSY